MTCWFVSASIEDLVDDHLSSVKIEQVRRHLDSCKKCREEYQETINLKKLLQRVPTFDPGPDYWSETSRLIRARTIEFLPQQQLSTNPRPKATLHRHALVRSLVSVAASLFILVAVMMVSSGKDKRLWKLDVTEAPILATAPVSELLWKGESKVITQAEQMRFARGILLMGNPSFLGRFAGLSDMVGLNE